MISIVIPSTEISKMEKWAKNVIIQCFEFSLAEIFYRYLKMQNRIVMHISSNNEIYE